MVKKQKYSTRVRHYKGKVPLKIDLLLFSLLRMVFSFMFFFMIYIMFIGIVRYSPNYSIITEIMYIFIVMIGSDALGRIMASLLDTFIMNRWGYLRNTKARNTLIFSLVNYVIYTILRVLFLVFNFTFAMINFFMNNYLMAYLWAFFIAWILSSIIARITAWIITQFII